MNPKVIITTPEGIQLYTKEEVAKVLNISVSTVNRYMSDEIIKPYKNERLSVILFEETELVKVAIQTNKTREFLINTRA